MADQLFLEKQRDAGESGKYGVSYKIRKIGFPIAVVCCIVLMIICIVLAILYSKEVNKPAIVPKEKPEYEICDDDHCFNVGIEMVRKMNKKVDPCEDFYAYACEGWENRHPLENDSDSENSVVKLTEAENYMMTKKALETAHLSYSGNSAVMKTVRFYESCMNVTAADALGLQPLKVLLQEYGGWTVSSNYDSNVTIATRIGKTFRELGVKSLFGVVVKVDSLDSTKTIIKLTGSSIKMKRDSYLEEDDESRKKRQAYKKLLKTIGKMFGVSGSSDEKMMAIYDFEKRIAQIGKESNLDSDDDGELFSQLGKRSRVRRHSKNDARATLLSFCNSFNVSWPFVKETLSIIFRRNFTGNEKIIFKDTFPKYFKAIYSLFKNTKESVVADYIMWQVVRKYLWALPEKFNSTVLEFDRITNDSTSATPRSRECFDSLNSAFDLTLGLLYVDVMFKDDPKKKIEEMFENVRSTFVDRLKTIKWLDSPTKEMAIQKALNMKADIGYPSFIKDRKKLENRYEMVSLVLTFSKFRDSSQSLTLNITDNLFTNYKAKKHFEIMENLNTYGKHLEKDMWSYSSFIDVNGLYVVEQNKIVILAGILHPPYYSRNNLMYLNYGGVGMIIGHEIVHGFDEHGRPFDSNGNNKNWWSEYSKAKYKQKAKCLEEKYNQYTFMGERVNGSFTLDENTADDGGVKVAYEAYQRWTRKHGSEKILPGMTLNPDQLFFLGFAQRVSNELYSIIRKSTCIERTKYHSGWCSVLSAKAAHDYKTDPHTIPKYRIIGSLSNFDKFSEVFDCPSDSPMNAKTKCNVW